MRRAAEGGSAGRAPRGERPAPRAGRIQSGAGELAEGSAGPSPRTALAGPTPEPRAARAGSLGVRHARHQSRTCQSPAPGRRERLRGERVPEPRADRLRPPGGVSGRRADRLSAGAWPTWPACAEGRSLRSAPESQSLRPRVSARETMRLDSLRGASACQHGSACRDRKALIIAGLNRIPPSRACRRAPKGLFSARAPPRDRQQVQKTALFGHVPSELFVKRCAGIVHLMRDSAKQTI